MSTFSKAYKPKETEEKIYKLWQESGFFTPENLPGKRKENFTVCIAPPNITGELHMGHALENTLVDIVVRMKRMKGYKTLWVPGIDHAGIAAQNTVEKQLKKEGIRRNDLGRERFLERMWAWKDKYGNTISEQLRKLGCSLDWSKERFTLDEKYQNSVQEAFLHYYMKGWIYKGIRVVNWCPRCATSISDLEVSYKSEKGKLYFIKYGPFIVATTRPETKLGDTALAVHPDDKRYKKYINHEIEIDTVDNSIPPDQPPKLKKIKIKVVADKAVDPKFGTGIIKVTPAHDLTDAEIANRHNLEFKKIINENGRMNKNAGKRYQGVKTSQAREKIAEDLTILDLMEKVEDYEHNTARCERCDSVIEPLPSKQWFLKMKELAQHALVALKKKNIVFHPPRWSKPYSDWLKNIKDWNISRQLWWGHKMPIWMHEPMCIPKKGKGNEFKKCQDIKISTEKPECEYCDAGYTQVEDVLDTWFSSALWPFAVLGWPSSIKNSDFKKYYPTQMIASARDILNLWIARMIFSGIEFTGKPPFKDIYIHPTVLTKSGQRMSKSLGTGINPMNLTEKYGTDALRFGLAYQTTGVQDMKFNEDVIAMGKKFANKLWNISRYVLIKLDENYVYNGEIQSKNRMIKKIKSLSKNTAKNIEAFKFGQAAYELYHFVWHDFADIYLEQTKSKNDKETKDILMFTLVSSLKLLHPFMPFITEEIYSKLPVKKYGKSAMLMIEKWPD